MTVGATVRAVAVWGCVYNCNLGVSFYARYNTILKKIDVRLQIAHLEENCLDMSV